MKLTLKVVASIFFFFATVAGLSSARNTWISKNYAGYLRESFTITGVGSDAQSGDGGTQYHVSGRSPATFYDIKVSAARFEKIRESDSMGSELTVYRNPTLPHVAYQTESLNVLFEDQWRDRAELDFSRRSTFGLAMIALVLSALLFLAAMRYPRKMAVNG